jgi:hypothetical protein
VREGQILFGITIGGLPMMQEPYFKDTLLCNKPEGVVKEES